MSAGNSIVYYMGSTTQTLNLTESKVTLDTTSQIDTDTFSVSSGVITVKEAGTYLVINHLAVDRSAGTDSARTSGESFLHVNNTLVAGCYTDGYLRRSGSSDEFSDCAYGIYEFAVNDEVEMRQLRINAAGSDGRIVGNVTTYMDGKTSLTIIKLNDDNAKIILEATSSVVQSLTVDNGQVDMQWDDEIVKDTGFTHSEVTDSDEITLDAIGKYLAVYSNSWDRGTATTSKVRTGNYEVLQLDGSIIPGSYHNNYIRGSQSGEQIMRGNNSAMVLFETTSVNQKLKLTAAREDGDLTNNRLPLKSRMVVYKLNGDEKTFRIESASTENIGSTTEATMTYDSSDWIDTGFSLASNQVEVTDATKMLIMQGVQSDSSGTTRAGTYQFGRFNGTNNKYGTCTKYSRNSGAMQMLCPHWASIQSIGDSQKLECRMDNTFTNSTLKLRVANTGAFCGIDLSTLATSIQEETGSFSESLGVQMSMSGEKAGESSLAESLSVQMDITGAKEHEDDFSISHGIQMDIDSHKGGLSSIDFSLAFGSGGDGGGGFVLVGNYGFDNGNMSRVLNTTFTELGQTFKALESGKLVKAKFNLSMPSGTGALVAHLYAHTGTYGSTGVPTGSPLATSEVYAYSDYVGASGWSEFIFTDGYELVKDTAYCIVVDFNTFSTIMYVNADNSSPTHGGNSVDYISSWDADTNYAFTFEVFVDSAGYTSPSKLDEYDVTWQNTGWSMYSEGSEERGQTFKLDFDAEISSVKFMLAKSGSPTGNAYAKLYAHTGTFGTDGKPTGTPLATSEAFDVSTLITAYGLTEFTFSTDYKVDADTPYAICVSFEDGDSSNYILFGYDTAEYTHEGNYFYYWEPTDIYSTNSSRDGVFELYGSPCAENGNVSGQKGGLVSISETLTESETLSIEKGGLVSISETLTPQMAITYDADNVQAATGSFAISVTPQTSFKGGRGNATLIYNDTIDNGTHTNWTAYQGTLSDGNPGAKIVASAVDTETLMYKSQTVDDTDFPMEISFEYDGIREAEMYIRFFDSGFSNYLNFTFDSKQINGKNVFRVIKDDFTENGTLDWDDVAYIAIGAYPYPGETAEFNLLSIKGGVAFRPSVVLSFDDGADTVIDTVKSILDAKSFKATAYVVPDWIGSNDAVFMTLAEVKTLHAAGWDIGNHGYESLDPTSLSVQDIQDDYEDFIDWAETNEVTGAEYHMAYPDGITNDNTDTAATNAGLLTGRTILNGENTHYGNPLYLYQIMLGSTSTFDDFLTAYKHAVRTSSSLQVTIHSVVTTPTETYELATSVFQQIVNFLDNNNVDVLTISEFYAVTHRDEEISESLTVQDLFSIEKAGYVSISDSIVSQVGITAGKYSDDIVLISLTPQLSILIRKSSIATIDISEVVTVNAASEKEGQNTISESVSIGVSVNGQKGAKASISESLTIQMAITYYAYSVIEKEGTISITETLQEGITIRKNGRSPPLTESLGISDSIISHKNGIVSLSESLVIQDNANVEKHGIVSISESLILSCNIESDKLVEGQISESLAIQQSISASKGGQGVVSITEGAQSDLQAISNRLSLITFTLTPQVIITAERSTEGTASISLSPQVSMNGEKGAKASISEALGTQGSVLIEKGGLSSIDESLVIGMSIVSGVKVDISLGVQMSMSHTTARESSISESLTVQDNFDIKKNIEKTVSISLGSNMSINGQKEGIDDLSISIGLQQSINSHKTGLSSLSESISIQDNLGHTTARVCSISESLGIQIGISGGSAAATTLSESLVVQMSMANEKAAYSSISESIVADITVIGGTAGGSTISESIGIQFTLSAEAHKQSSISESIGINLSITGERFIEGSLSISSGVQINMSGFKHTSAYLSILERIQDNLNTEKNAFASISESLVTDMTISSEKVIKEGLSESLGVNISVSGEKAGYSSVSISESVGQHLTKLPAKNSSVSISEKLTLDMDTDSSIRGSIAEYYIRTIVWNIKYIDGVLYNVYLKQSNEYAISHKGQKAYNVALIGTAVYNIEYKEEKSVYD